MRKNDYINPVTIRRFHNYFSAHILKTKFEEAGVLCYLFDENTMTINPIIGNAVGGIRLVVSEDEQQRAMELLDLFDKEYLENTTCPECRKGHFIQVPKQSTENIFTAILTWLFSSYAVSATNVYKCSNCGFETESIPDNYNNN
jgi:hypothetical protein